MAYITLDKDKLKHNYEQLEALFAGRDINWAVVTKLLCGNHTYLQVLADLGIRQFCDSRIANLKFIKTNFPDVETIFIKPPAKRNAEKVVAYADISFNTSYDTILRLSEAAVKQGRKHRIVIMVELGELREGVMGKNLKGLYERIYQLPGIEVIGLGTNLTCMYGVLPSYDKLTQLVDLKTEIEKQFGTKPELVSGGASVTIPLIERNELPAAVNHFRVGETLFLGTDVYSSVPMKGMYNNVFMLYGEIIELAHKPNVPYGDMGYNLSGEKKDFSDEDFSKESYRAIVDIGLLDMDIKHVEPEDKDIRVAGVSSDMTVLDLGENQHKYKVGDKIAFTMDYMGILRIMNSRYIEKRVHTESMDIARQALEAIAN